MDSEVPEELADRACQNSDVLLMDLTMAALPDAGCLAGAVAALDL